MQANAATADGAAQHLGHFAVEDGTAPPTPPLSAEEAGSLAQQLLERWYHDIPQFAWDCFGVILWRRQKDICEGMVRCARAVRTNKGKRRIAVKSGQKCGKALALDTPVPTPTGWTTMGALKVGDQVFDEHGTPCNVVAATDVLHDRPCYDVVFSDGTVVTADENHQWLTATVAARRSASRKVARPRSYASVVTTGEILATLDTGRGKNHAVKTCGPVEYPAADLPMDPYVLGAWLGDGTSRAATITSADPQLLGELRRCGVKVGRGKRYQARGKARRYSILRYKGLRTRDVLRGLGVFGQGNKHVPAIYLRGSVEQRLGLLQGLMDTDGSADRKGRAEFCNTSRQIAEAVYEIVASLGMKPTLLEGRAMLKGKDCGPKYRVYFITKLPVFRLTRKLARLRGPKSDCNGTRTIVEVRPRASVPVRCIQVDSASSLFLCSRAFIPTHNSILIAVLALWWAVTRSDGMVVLVAPTGNQIRNILWSELTTLYGKAVGRLADFGISGGLGGQLNKVPDLGLQFSAKNSIVGRATNTPERMQGTSGENLLYLVDEASGVDIKIFEVVEGNTQGGGVIVMLGNPTQTSGPFYDAFNRNAHLYEQFSISSEETPNFKSKRVVVRGLATYDAILDRRKSWGGADYVNDPRYQIRVLGNFPTSAYNQVFSITDNITANRVWYAHAAEMLGRQQLLLNREDRPRIIQPGEIERVRARWESQAFPYPLRIGVDPAHEGDDLTTIYPRRGIHLYRPEVVKHGDGPVVAERVLEVVRRHRRWDEKPVILIDAIGVGVSAYDVLKRSSEVTVLPINSYLAAADPVEFHNLRSELWFNARDWVRVLGGGWEPLPEQELENDLLSPLFAIDAAGRCEVEAKKKIKARIGHSPDHADGFNLAVYEQPNMFDRVFDPTRKVKSSLRFGATQRGF